ncbi:hypothetical protein GGR42_002216 [Saonia flava]|uniref:FAD-dependent urate hydroxylase HpyO/Asp monooxygenase CreE-like FAD/NAD(P)-binding domain-containing protein n=1 Tax=Saonia flava TaxID=523696 RepID=A0A846R310_9FLAO|nr:FAD/NAD(P)-binding protein [Saonia flava]NJB71754.1 hypothetical protein [Saonia flava]
MANKRKVGIIGIGPRGGWAMENLVIELNKRNSLMQIHLLLFEETGKFGNGQVYDTNQIQSNWINISERILLLDERKAIVLTDIIVPSFPSYHQWAAKDFEVLSKDQADTYPPRAKIGNYLQQRFQSFVYPLIKINMVSLFQEHVEEVTIVNQNKISIKTDLNTYKEIDEVLLTIGHQTTKLSKQLVKWDNYSAHNENIKLFKAPYPITEFLNDDELTHESVVGIRGFGLAMIDVARAIANKFGNFIPQDEFTKVCTFESNHSKTPLLVPFSLNGMPPAPKPLNPFIDEWFEPTDEQISKFEYKIGNSSAQKKAANPNFLISAFTPIAAKIYAGLAKSYCKGEFSIHEIEKVIEEWLQNNDFEHPTIIPQIQSTKKTMQDFVNMAIGRKDISLDYCIGQVWRYCQPSIYEKLSFNKCSEQVFAEIIELDESIKRYSYGPPVESIQQLLALVDTGIIDLGMLNNPEFELTNEGWLFKLNGKTQIADFMINSVLDAPKIQDVNSSIVKKMLSNNLIEPIHDDLGVATDENGYVASNIKSNDVPIALLGRLAKGTIIGVDAILECFGERPQKWAVEATNRHSYWLKQTKNGTI